MQKPIVVLIVSILGFAIANSQISIPPAELAKSQPDQSGSLITSVINRTITYQGILKDNTGNPVGDDNYNLTFRVYNASSGGLLLWTSSPITVTTKNGLFSTSVGPISLPFDTTYYLSVQVQDDVEMTRQMMTMTPYSASSDTANYAKAGVSDTKWSFRITDTADTTLITGGNWGIARNGNVLYGNADSTHVNLGIACTTGTSGSNYMYSTVSGGFGNTAGGYSSVIGGGFYNTASRAYSAIGGGFWNIANGMNSVIGGGEHNTASGNSSAIGGGGYDTVKAIYGGVASGYSNLAGDASTDTGTFVGGGVSNKAIAKHATVTGGWGNLASGMQSTIGGGERDTASNQWSAVAGGAHNIASGFASMIPGGSDNVAAGNRSFAAGLGAHASHDGSFVWADDSPVSFFSDRDQQAKFRAGGGVKFNVNASRWVEFYDDGVDRLINVSNNAYLSRGGTWTNASDRNLKENFRPVDGSDILRKIASLSVLRWNYKSENQSVTHIGPTAQDFNALFGVGNDTTAISTIDPAGVALAGVQELMKIIEAQNNKIEELQSQISELKNR